MNKKQLIFFIKNEMTKLEDALEYNLVKEKDNIIGLSWIGGKLESYKEILKYVEEMEQPK